MAFTFLGHEQLTFFIWDYYKEILFPNESCPNFCIAEKCTKCQYFEIMNKEEIEYIIAHTFA